MQLVTDCYDRADAALELKQFDLALQLVIEGLAVNPDCADLLSLAAQIQIRRFESRAACEFARQAIGKNPESSLGYFWLAHSLLQLSIEERKKENAGAELTRAVQRMLEILPDDYSSHQLAGLLAWDHGDFAGAERCYRRALELDPTNDQTLQSLGRLTRQLHRLDESRELLETLRSLHPNHGHCFRELAWLHLQTQDSEAALHFALAARDIVFTEAETFDVLAEAAFATKDFELALQSNRDSLRLNPHSAYALTFGAQVLIARAQYREACEFARKAIALEPARWDAHYWLAYALNWIAELSHEQAERYIEHAALTSSESIKTSTLMLSPTIQPRRKCQGSCSLSLQTVDALRQLRGSNSSGLLHHLVQTFRWFYGS